MSVLTDPPLYEMPTQKMPVLPTQKTPFAPLIMLLAMLGSLLLLAAVLPLRGLWFYDVLLTTPLGRWLILPTHLLFPGSDVIFFKAGYHVKLPEPLAVCWLQTGYLLLSLVVLFLCYLLSLKLLPRVISRRFVLLSTALLGGCLCLFPVATSQDIFSYIIYARMGAIYHLNPLTTLPIALPHDAVISRVYWTKQPSAYGPTWAILTTALQWLAIRVGLTNPFSMAILLRLLGLAAHLGSIQLAWSICSRIQAIIGTIAPRKRLLAVLAFAWNPLLLFEACVNAHTDTVILFLVLLAVWALLPRNRNALLAYSVAAALLALAACIKITLVGLIPGLFLYILSQRSQRVMSLLLSGLAYIGTIGLLYAPFWQGGAVLHVLQVNPGITHAINTPYEFVIHLYASLMRIRVASATSPTGSPIEVTVHGASMLLFVTTYLVTCIYYLLSLRRMRPQDTIPALIRWMAVAWLLYCLVGSPWFWPWYAIPFFGLYALVEGTNTRQKPLLGFLEPTTATRLLTFSLLSTYCFLSIATLKSYVALPGLYRFQWSYLAGPWIYLIPLLAVGTWFWPRFLQRKSSGQS